MARPMKTGLDYFPVDISIMTDRKLRKVKLKYGGVGFQIYFALLCIIYGDKGYYLDFGNGKQDDVVWEVLEKLQGKFQPTAETIVEIIEDLVACELFSDDQFKSKIITSKRMQSTYYSATVEREAINVNFGIWLLSQEEMTALSKRSIILRNFINPPINEDNQPINEEEQPIKPQSKPKEKKVKESKFTPPTLEQIAAYVEERGSDVDPEKFFDFFDVSGWVDSKGNPVKSWKQKLITWEKNRTPKVKASDYKITPDTILEVLGID